jgi:RNA recognition motif-containing protein
MLKISKDKLKVKRRIPFRQEYRVENPEETDGAMVYVERYPEELSHEQLATIFKRAGRIKHISMPKFKGSKQPKGFAFVLFSSAAEADVAVETFNNTVPTELVDAMSPNFVPV